MNPSHVTIHRLPSGFELKNWSDNAAHAVGLFLITDAPHSLEQLEGFLTTDQQELLLTQFKIDKKEDSILLVNIDDRHLVANLPLARFIGVVQEWLFFLKNEAPEITFHLTPLDSKDDQSDPNVVHIALGQYGGQKIISTRFPRAWSKEDIVEKVQEALSRVIEGSDDKVIGVTKDNVVLQMYIKNNQVYAVFPAKLYNIKA